MGSPTHRYLAAAFTVFAAAALLLPAASLAAAGSLDRSFHGNGRLVIKAIRPESSINNSFEVTRLALPSTLSAPGPKGELVVVEPGRVLRFRADGRPQRKFGDKGHVTISTPLGTSFQLAGVAVDSRGRVLVAGTTAPPGATGGTQYARVSVYRYTPKGKLDRSFGESGVAGVALGPMEATGLAVDSRDRPVLTGLSALTPSFCKTLPVYLNTTVVARLTTGGAPDPTFGDGSGTYTDQLEDPHLPALVPGRGIVYTSAPEQRCSGFEGYGAGAPAASILSPGGNLALRFPVRPGTPNLPGLASSLDVQSLAVDRQNRIVLLMTAYASEAGGNLQVVRRLLPDGRPDPEFSEPYWEGEPGIVGTPGPPGSRFTAVTTDARNRVVLTASYLRHEGRLVPEGFLAMRLNAAGKEQTWFGRDGMAKIAFGRHTNATPTQVYLDSRGRIVLSGSVVTLQPNRPPTNYSLAFARLLSGKR